MRDTILDQLAELEGKTPEQIDQFVFAEGLDRAEHLRRLALKIRSEQAVPSAEAKRYWSRSLQAKVTIQPETKESVDCVLGYQLSAEGQTELVYGLVLPRGAAALDRIKEASYIKPEDYPFDTPSFDDQSQYLVAYTGSQLHASHTFILTVLAENTDYVDRRVSQALRLGGRQLGSQLQGPTPAYRDASRALVPSDDYFLDDAQRQRYSEAVSLVEKANGPEALRAAQVKAEMACGSVLFHNALKEFTSFCEMKVNKKKEQGALARDFNSTGRYNSLVTVRVLVNGNTADILPNYQMTDEQAESLGLAAEWQAVKKARSEAAAVDFLVNVEAARRRVAAALEQVKATVKSILEQATFPRILFAKYPQNQNFNFTTERVLRGGRVAFSEFSISDAFIALHAVALQNSGLNPENIAKVYAAFKAELKNQVSDYLTAKHHELEEKKRVEALPKKVKASDLLAAAKDAYFGKHENRRAKADDPSSYHSLFMKRLVSQLKEKGEERLTLQDLASAIAPKDKQNRYCLFGDRGRTVLRENALQSANGATLNADKYGTDAALQAVISALKKPGVSNA